VRRRHGDTASIDDRVDEPSIGISIAEHDVYGAIGERDIPFASLERALPPISRHAPWPGGADHGATGEPATIGRDTDRTLVLNDDARRNRMPTTAKSGAD